MPPTLAYAINYISTLACGFQTPTKSECTHIARRAIPASIVRARAHRDKTKYMYDANTTKIVTYIYSYRCVVLYSVQPPQIGGMFGALLIVYMFFLVGCAFQRNDVCLLVVAKRYGMHICGITRAHAFNRATCRICIVHCNSRYLRD